jgi:predicted outer membrane repeat protein
MEGGAMISSNTADGDGGGVYHTGNGEFTMEGGAISGNEAITHGGGVYVDGTFTMSGGGISGN